jgi:hypothetical protein
MQSKKIISLNIIAVYMKHILALNGSNSKHSIAKINDKYIRIFALAFFCFVLHCDSSHSSDHRKLKSANGDNAINTCRETFPMNKLDKTITYIKIQPKAWKDLTFYESNVPVNRLMDNNHTQYLETESKPTEEDQHYQQINLAHPIQVSLNIENSEIVAITNQHHQERNRHLRRSELHLRIVSEREQTDIDSRSILSENIMSLHAEDNARVGHNRDNLLCYCCILAICLGSVSLIILAGLSYSKA